METRVKIRIIQVLIKYKRSKSKFNSSEEIFKELLCANNNCNKAESHIIINRNNKHKIREMCIKAIQTFKRRTSEFLEDVIFARNLAKWCIQDKIEVKIHVEINKVSEEYSYRSERILIPKFLNCLLLMTELIDKELEGIRYKYKDYDIVECNVPNNEFTLYLIKSKSVGHFAISFARGIDIKMKLEEKLWTALDTTVNILKLITRDDANSLLREVFQKGDTKGKINSLMACIARGKLSPYCWKLSSFIKEGDTEVEKLILVLLKVKILCSRSQ